MNAKLLTRAACLTLALLSGGSFAHADDGSDLKQLRTENAQLKAKIDALKSACQVQIDEPPPAANAPATVPAPANNVPAPPKYILVPAPAPHSQTGCGTLFSNGPDVSWKHAENWSSLHKGDSMTDVEKLLGTDHYDVASKGRVAWQFGKCGVNVQGTAVFDGGHLLFWTAPDF